MKIELSVLAIYILGVFVGGLAIWANSVLVSALILILGAAVGVGISLTESKGGRHGQGRVRRIQSTSGVQ